MKCPSCGREVVIATNLCPWCGYKYSFDGSLAPKEPVYEPGETKRERRGKREGSGESERRSRTGGYAGEDASERWTRAGVYNAGEHAGREKRSDRSGERGMGVHNFLVRVALPLIGVVCIWRAVSSLMTAIGSAAWISVLWSLAPFAAILQFVVPVVYLVSGFAALVARKRLAAFKFSGVTLCLVSIILPTVTAFIYSVFTAAYFDFGYIGVFSQAFWLLAGIICTVLIAMYYSRRRDMSSGN